jgi:DNA-binding PadR family transcriptional regulator
MLEDLKPFLPLSPAALHILLCLSAEPCHGYGIMREVDRQSDGQYQLGPGTLYDNLQKLMNSGLVAEARRPTADEDPRRRYYRLTELGRRVLEADVVRLKRVVREAGFNLREPHPRRA